MKKFESLKLLYTTFSHLVVRKLLGRKQNNGNRRRIFSPFIYFFAWFWPLCRAGHATLQRSPPLWGVRGSSPWRRIWEDFWWPRSWSKDKAWVIAATQTGNRRGLRWWGRGRGAIFTSQITSGMEGENITIITAPGMSRAKEQEVMEDQ